MMKKKNVYESSFCKFCANKVLNTAINVYWLFFFSFLFIIVKKDECFFVSSGSCQCTVHQQPGAE